MKAKERKKPVSVKGQILLIERELRQLAGNLEADLSRRKKEQKRRDAGSTPFDRRVHEYKIEAGRLLAKADELGGFQQLGRLRWIIGTWRWAKFNPDFGHSRVFVDACLNWIPKQSDGFDFEWKRKQLGDVKAYVMAMRYLADCLAKSQMDDVGQKPASAS